MGSSLYILEILEVSLCAVPARHALTKIRQILFILELAVPVRIKVRRQRLILRSEASGTFWGDRPLPQ